MCKVVVVGSNPSEASENCMAFDISTKSGRTLNDWFKSIDANITLYLNVANHTTPKNRALTSKEITAALPLLNMNIELVRHVENVKIVAVGKTAVKALTLLGVNFYEMPHPSGMNRLLNDPVYVAGKINGLKEFLLETT